MTGYHFEEHTCTVDRNVCSRVQSTLDVSNPASCCVYIHLPQMQALNPDWSNVLRHFQFSVVCNHFIGQNIVSLFCCFVSCSVVRVADVSPGLYQPSRGLSMNCLAETSTEDETRDNTSDILYLIVLILISLFNVLETRTYFMVSWIMPGKNIFQYCLQTFYHKDVSGILLALLSKNYLFSFY